MMGIENAISVVIPSRDRSRFAAAAVESVLGQTSPVAQIVLVDDGSTPEHAAGLERLAARHDVIELHRHSRSRGAAAARNLGLEHARGDLVLFLDDDDRVHPRFCEDGLAVMRAESDAGAVVFLYECFVTPKGFREARALFNPVPAGFLERRPVSAFIRYLIPIHSCLVRRERIGERRFPERLKQGEDTYFWISLANGGCRFVSDRRAYAYVRRHAGNATHCPLRYAAEIQLCYEALLADRQLSDPADRFLAHLKLLSFKLFTRRPGWGNDLRRVVAAPHRLLRELAFWSANRITRGRAESAG